MLAQRIGEIRIKKGLSQSQLAEMLHVSASTVGMYEQGRRVPHVDILVAMSQIFEVSLDYLITGSDYLYSNAEARLEQIANDCPCSTCYWKKAKNHNHAVCDRVNS